tara:strand:+ start:1232 stop:1399 length:168 start_codon:yes stop_codon:yes gene_type:complete
MKKKLNVNTDKLNEWISPSAHLLKKPKLNQVSNAIHKGKPIMSEEEFDKIMNNER